MALYTQTLDNGAIVLIDKRDDTKMLSMGYYFRVGSRYETPEQNGAAHFLEHMAYKGTKTRDVHALAEQMDDLGATANAFTSLHSTCYHLTGLAEDTQNFNELLGDIVLNLTLPKNEMDTERGAIVEEINRSDDLLTSVAVRNLYKIAFPNSSISRTVLGPVDNIRQFTPDVLRGFHQDHYHGGNLIVSVSGNVDPALILKNLEQTAALLPTKDRSLIQTPVYEGGTIHEVRKETKQLNLYLAFPSVTNQDTLAPAAQMLGRVLGSGFSSRLFREVRERRGLVYTISSGSTGHSDFGLFHIYAGTGADKAQKIMPVIYGEIKKIQQDLISDAELARVKRKIKVGLMGDEDTQDRMRNIADEYNARGRNRTKEELWETYNAVTREDIRHAAQRIFSGNPSVSTVGPEGSEIDYGAMLAHLKM